MLVKFKMFSIGNKLFQEGFNFIGAVPTSIYFESLNLICDSSEG